MPKRTPKRGGARPGAGRPRTTGTGSAKPVSYKLADTDRARAEAAARQHGIVVNELARRALLAELDAPRLNRRGDERNR